jgi:hypothetical protein
MDSNVFINDLHPGLAITQAFFIKLGKKTGKEGFISSCFFITGGPFAYLWTTKM